MEKPKKPEHWSHFDGDIKLWDEFNAWHEQEIKALEDEVARLRQAIKDCPTIKEISDE